MTPKQVERIKKKIAQIKRELAADKRRWGGYYDDSRGLRYLPPELYLKLQDYSGALSYFKWFHKNFPNDMGFPIFLFEWTITLFKTQQIKQAEKKALETFFSNTYLVDKFLQKKLLDIDKMESSNWATVEQTKYLEYSKDQKELTDFADWLGIFVTTQKFQKFKDKFIELSIMLKTEPLGPKRIALVNELGNLFQNIDD